MLISGDNITVGGGGGSLNLVTGGLLVAAAPFPFPGLFRTRPGGPRKFKAGWTAGPRLYGRGSYQGIGQHHRLIDPTVRCLVEFRLRIEQGFVHDAAVYCLQLASRRAGPPSHW